MPRDLRLLPGGERRIGLLQSLLRLGLQLGELLLDGHGVLVGGERFQLGDLTFKLGNRLFEIEVCAHVAKGGPTNPQTSGLPLKGVGNVFVKWPWGETVSTGNTQGHRRQT